MKKIILLTACMACLAASAKETFPDGTPIPEWFNNDTPTDIHALGKQYVITDYGIVNDSTLLQTGKIQAVIDRAAREGGGTIVIPEGTYLSGALFFKPGTHLHLEENATLKVLAYKHLTSLPIIADDSGLIVDYLGKDFPGIQSHRYALTFSSQQECNKYVANKALNSPCHFICSISLLYNDKIYNFQGKVDGRITQEKGANGFGYDPIFFVQAKNKTFGELTKEEKDEISHRGQAARSLLKFLEKNY